MIRPLTIPGGASAGIRPESKRQGGRQLRKTEDARRGSRVDRRSLSAFIGYLEPIVPRKGVRVRPRSTLIGELGFDSVAFGSLALLLAERYGIGGLSTTSVQSGGDMTVEEFFHHCVLKVLGLAPIDDRKAREK